jgi:acyl carrier protein
MEAKTAIEKKLFLYVSDYCSVNSAILSSETITNDIGLDSLSLSQILANLESDFDFELQDEDLTNLLEARSIGNYVDILTEALDRSRSRRVDESSE